MTPMRGLPGAATWEQTCGACPEQYEGTLQDGRAFYFRYRSGRAELGIGVDLIEAVMATLAHTRARVVGDSSQGMFDSEAQRDRVFAELLAEVTH